MRQHTSILSKPIKKLPYSKLTHEVQISSKLVQKKKNKRTLQHSSQKDDPFVSQPLVIAIDEESTTLMRDPQDYLLIGEVPVYKPTKEELAEPFRLLRALKAQGYEKYGAVKLLAPEEWTCQFSFNPTGKLITTRKQILANLIKGKAFEYNMDGYSLEEYRHFADNFAKDYSYKTLFGFESIYRANEYEYWAHVEDPEYLKYHTTVEYAADLPSSKYGSGFPVTSGRMTEELDPIDLKTHPMNLNNLGQAKDSLFQIIKTKMENISGISSPWVYLGMLFASFCWHVEDLYMYSVNYMHVGAPKTWYCVPGAYKEALDDTIKERYGELFIQNPGLMYNITQTMNPLELIKRNIPVYRTEQKAGEFIITFPKVYHAGFSHGFNAAEAVNVATEDWIHYAKLAMEDYAIDGFNKKGSFPIEWILFENIIMLDYLEFSEEIKKKLIDEFKEIIRRELEKREMIQKCYKKFLTKKFQNIAVRYDANVCSTCQNYTYLSYLSCMMCQKVSCVHHITNCDCIHTTIVLNVRYTDEELKKLLKDQ